jgi:DNA-binding transcriptional MerR regulator
MKIGEVSRRLGITPQAVRFYEHEGLVPQPSRTDIGYREFGALDFERLRLLVGLRRLDVPLESAASIAAICAEGRCDEATADLREVIGGRRREIALRIDELKDLDRRLRSLDARLASGSQPQTLIKVGKESRLDV